MHVVKKYIFLIVYNHFDWIIIIWRTFKYIHYDTSEYILTVSLIEFT